MSTQTLDTMTSRWMPFQTACRRGSISIFRARSNSRTRHIHQLANAFTTLVCPSKELTQPSVSLLQTHIKNRNVTAALKLYDDLKQKDGKSQLSQELEERVSVLLVLQKSSNGRSPDPIHRATSILRKAAVVSSHVSSYTQVAFIYVIDACVAHGELDLALELVDEANALNLYLDLPAYECLLKALVRRKKDLERAQEMLYGIIRRPEVAPNARCYIPVLVGLIQGQEFKAAMKLFVESQDDDVVFSLDDLNRISDCAMAHKPQSSEKDADHDWDCFLSVVEDVQEQEFHGYFNVDVDLEDEPAQAISLDDPLKKLKETSIETDVLDEEWRLTLNDDSIEDEVVHPDEPEPKKS